MRRDSLVASIGIVLGMLLTAPVSVGDFPGQQYIDISGDIQIFDVPVGQGWTVTILNLDDSSEYVTGTNGAGEWSIDNVAVDPNDRLRIIPDAPNDDYITYSVETSVLPWDISTGLMQVGLTAGTANTPKSNAGTFTQIDLSALLSTYGAPPAGQKDITVVLTANQQGGYDCTFSISAFCSAEYHGLIQLPNGQGLNPNCYYWQTNQFTMEVLQISRFNNVYSLVPHINGGEVNPAVYDDPSSNKLNFEFQGAAHVVVDPEFNVEIDNTLQRDSFPDDQTIDSWNHGVGQGVLLAGKYKLQVNIVNVWTVYDYDHNAQARGPQLDTGTINFDPVTIWVYTKLPISP